MKMINKASIIVLITVMMAMLLISCGNNEATNNANSTEVAETESNSEVVVENYVVDGYIISAEQLHENIDNNEYLILDARGDEAYAKGHIPGAINVTWPGFANVNGAPGDEGWGVVLDAETLSERLSAVGVDQNKTVIVYADTLNGWGEDGRIVWMLRMAGIEKSMILDGGFNYWTSEDFDTSKEATLAVATDFNIEKLNESLTISSEELTSTLAELTIIDTREQNEFDGEANFGEKRGGHLPNSKLLTFNHVLNEDGRFKSASELEELFKSAGLDKEDNIVTYCTAGIRSAHLQIALNMMGYNTVRNYDASFYEYAANETLPLESKYLVKDDYKYYTQDQVKHNIENQVPFVLLDIQVEDEFDLHHIKGATASYAYPIKSDDDKSKLDALLPTLEASNNRIVIVCPKGGGGAERTVNYLLEKGIDDNRLFILENGQAGWSHEDLLNK